MFGEVFTEFYAGRIKPGKFEYPKLNGLMLIKDAKDSSSVVAIDPNPFDPIFHTACALLLVSYLAPTYSR